MKKSTSAAFFCWQFPKANTQREGPEAWPPTAHTSSAACTRAFPTHVRTAQVRDGEFQKPIPLWRRAAHPPSSNNTGPHKTESTQLGLAGGLLELQEKMQCSGNATHSF